MIIPPIAPLFFSYSNAKQRSYCRGASKMNYPLKNFAQKFCLVLGIVTHRKLVHFIIAKRNMVTKNLDQFEPRGPFFGAVATCCLPIGSKLFGAKSSKAC
jgi:hypothetical protein